MVSNHRDEESNYVYIIRLDANQIQRSVDKRTIPKRQRRDQMIILILLRPENVTWQIPFFLLAKIDSSIKLALSVIRAWDKRRANAFKQSHLRA